MITLRIVEILLGFIKRSTHRAAVKMEARSAAYQLAAMQAANTSERASKISLAVTKITS